MVYPYTALVPLFVNGVRAFNTGDGVPASSVTKYGWFTSVPPQVALTGTVTPPVDPGTGGGGTPGGGGTGGLDAESVRDTIASALVAGANITITPNDGADTITISASGGSGTGGSGTTIAGISDATATGKSLLGAASAAAGRTVLDAAASSHTHTAGQVTDFAETARDVAAGMFRAGSNVTFAYDDNADTFTINAIAAGGSNVTDPEVVRDTIAAALVGGSNLQIVVDDANDTVRLNVVGLDSVYVPQSSVTALPATAFIPQGSLVPVTPVLKVNGAAPDPDGNATVSTGNICIVAETAAGYFLDGVKLTTRRRVGEYYTFIGLSDPPFQAVGDSWRQQDLGFSRELILKSSDAFNQGLELATPAAVTLNGTKWAGDSSYFRQGATGTLNPSSWGSTATTYLVIDQTALAARQAVELQLAGFSSNTTKTSLYVFLNVTSATATIATLNGYSIRAVIPSTGAADAYWHCQKWVNGTTTSLVGNTLGTTQEKDAGITSGITAKYDTDGAGRLTVTRNGAVVASWTDTSPHTGVYAGFGGNNAGGSGISASMNAKGDNWKAYA